eukprot:s171_g19.t1
MISAANPLYGQGTHRTNQCRETLQTPGPGAYRQLASFPVKDEINSNAQIFPRAPRGLLSGRARAFSRVSDIANPYIVISPIVGMFNEQVGITPSKMSASKSSINTLPPCNAGRILKGHGGSVPRGHGLPF